jgi:hypothetical protein
MQRSFFDYLCSPPTDETRGGAAASRPIPARELRTQVRRLIATRQTPLPPPASPRSSTANRPLAQLDRLLTYGFEQPRRALVTEQKDLQEVARAVTDCISRHFCESQVWVSPAEENRGGQGRTIVPVNVTVRMREAGASQLELRLDRMSRDVAMAGDPQFPGRPTRPAIA